MFNQVSIFLSVQQRNHKSLHCGWQTQIFCNNICTSAGCLINSFRCSINPALHNLEKFRYTRIFTAVRFKSILYLHTPLRYTSFIVNLGNCIFSMKLSIDYLFYICTCILITNPERYCSVSPVCFALIKFNRISFSFLNCSFYLLYCRDFTRVMNAFVTLFFKIGLLYSNIFYSNNLILTRQIR